MTSLWNGALAVASRPVQCTIHMPQQFSGLVGCREPQFGDRRRRIRQARTERRLDHRVYAAVVGRTREWLTESHNGRNTSRLSLRRYRALNNAKRDRAAFFTESTANGRIL